MTEPDTGATPGRAVELADEDATDRLATSLASALTPGWHIHLSGDLGAGKTRFTRGLLRALGYDGRVRSPTFTLFEPYELANFPLYHFDFYRFTSDNDWRDVGFDEWLSDENAVVVIEWPEMAGGQLPPADLCLFFECVDGEDRRTAHVHSQTARGQSWLTTVPGRPMLNTMIQTVPPPPG